MLAKHLRQQEWAKMNSAREQALDFYKRLLSDNNWNADTLAKHIRELVASGKTTWKKLGFTDKDMTERVEQARIREAKVRFERLIDTWYTPQVIERFASDIRELVASGRTTWEELGFTDEDVTKRLAQYKELYDQKSSRR